MLDFEFILDEFYIAAHTIFRAGQNGFIFNVPDEYVKSIKAFQNAAFDLNNKIYRFLDGKDPIYWILTYPNVKNFVEGSNILDEHIKKIMSLPEFKVLLDQTSHSMDLCQEEWAKNRIFTNKYLNEIGFNISNTYQVKMAHPGLAVGGFKDCIYWSYKTYFPNYNTVYLTHEALHDNLGKSDQEHALIELIADNELRVRLNGGEYPPFEGHARLDQIRTELLPDWQEFLQQEDKNIFEFASSLQT